MFRSVFVESLTFLNFIIINHQQIKKEISYHMNEVIALQNYKFVLLKKKQMLVLKKKIKGNTCNNSTKKERKVNVSSQLGKILRVLLRHWDRSGLFQNRP